MGGPAVPEVKSAVDQKQEAADQREDKNSGSHHGQIRDEAGDDQKSAHEQQDPAQQDLLDVLSSFKTSSLLWSIA